MGKTVSTNEGARSIAVAFWFQGDVYRQQAEDEATAPGKRVGLYNMAGNAYREACEWFEAARGMTIGHNKSARYEEQADTMRNKSMTAYDCGKALTLANGHARPESCAEHSHDNV